VPNAIEDNADLSIISPEERQNIIKHTGIRFRHIVQKKSVDVKELFETAINTLLPKLGWEKSTIDILICVTQTTTTSIPSVSCRLHGDMNFEESTLCFDINSGCSGFVYGLQTVQSLIQGFSKENVRAILCCGDLSSQLIEKNDKTTKPIFSDGISVIGIESTPQKNELAGYFNLATAGKGQGAIFTSKGDDDKYYMRLNGIDIYNYSMKYVPKNIIQLLDFSKKDKNFPDYYIFHQANQLINESIRKKLAIEIEKVPNSLYKFGNTASASIPVTLGTMWERNHKSNGWILVSGFGVGFSMASGLIKFNPQFCSSPIQLDL
jgi:3-oxoacyl-[acyl-carrier-protein] synthase-3